MVRGIDSFRKWFLGFEEQYTIIGGTACDLLMNEEGLRFRATKDLDVVLIVEALDSAFGKRFWDYILQAGYEHRNKSNGEPQFYRFVHPKSEDYPMMIELFSRKPNAVTLPDDAGLTPLLVDEDISSLSAILLDDDYYDFLRQGQTQVSGVTVLDARHLIPFKAKAWLDLSQKKQTGGQVDSRHIKKHKNDVFRLTELLYSTSDASVYLPEHVKKDMAVFLKKMEEETVDLKQLGIQNKTKESIIMDLRSLYM